MGLRDWFTKKTTGGAENALNTLFHTDREQNRGRCNEIKEIKIPPEIQAFTTGIMPFMTDGSLPEITVRFDAYRNESGGWDIRRFRGAKESTALAAAGIIAGEDDAFMGRALCDFDALCFLSEESAARGFGSKDAGQKYRDYPHWKTIAAQTKQPIDKNGIVQPVVKGRVLADNVTFDDPKQIEIRDSTLPPAIATAPAPIKTPPVPASKTGLLERVFNRITGRSGTLIWAARDGHKKHVQELLACGVDVNTVDGDGTTILIAAACGGHTEIAEMMIEARANDVNAADRWGSTALICAASHGHTEMVRLLLAAGANVNAANKDGYTALIAAACNGHTQSVRLLLAANADLNAKNRYGDTALMAAEHHRYPNIATLIRNHQSGKLGFFSCFSL